MHSVATLKQELEDRKRLFGINHICVAETLNVIGIMHHHITGDQEEAICNHQAALNILTSQNCRNNREILLHIVITIADIGNCYWKKGECALAKEMFCKAQSHLNKCFVHKSHPKKPVIQQSIQHRLAYLHNSCKCIHTFAKVDKQQFQCPLDTDSKLLDRLSSDNLISTAAELLNAKVNYLPHLLHDQLPVHREGNSKEFVSRNMCHFPLFLEEKVIF